MSHSPPARLIFAVAVVVPITLIHYATDAHIVELHNVYRRLYYIPIVLGAFASGVKGGLGVGVVATLGYLPHAFFSEHPDPAPAIDKVLEIVLYLAIGFLTGWLVEQQNKARAALQRSLDERDKLESQLVRAGKLSALGELSAGLAHEIRNPLASILGAAESLVREMDPADRKYRLGELLIQEVHRLNGVVKRFSAFARSAPVTRAVVNIMELAREVRDLSEAEANVRGITVVVRDEELELQVDGEQIVQVLLNVLLNAFEASVTSEVPHVEVGTADRVVGGRGYACIYVRDNGPGVPESLGEKVFDPYVTSRDDGTGLGLSISARIMEAHGGFLDLERVDDRTVAWLCFPEDT